MMQNTRRPFETPSGEALHQQTRVSRSGGAAAPKITLSTSSTSSGVDVLARAPEEADVADGLLHDHPVRLPASRGPVSESLLRLLDRDPGTPATDPHLVWDGPVGEALTDDDLQLTLWLTYELSYRGLAGVAEEWENQPQLVMLRRMWEHQLLEGLRHEVARRFTPPVAGDHASALRTPAEVVERLEELAGADLGPSLSGWLMKHATHDQFREFLVHRSIYHLKEADPHTWAIPRLSGAVKAAMITIQLDEYGSGRTPAMHAQLFRTLMIDWSLSATYGGQLDQAPGLTLLASNLISMFGLSRRWRGALVGHLAFFEMTSSTPNGRYARGHRRLGGSEEAARFFDEHVVADAVHEQIAAHQLAGGLARTEPQLAGDIVFGAQCAALADGLLADHLVSRWTDGRSSLRRPIEAS